VSFLLDTHLLIWAAMGSPRLSPAARAAIEHPAPPPVFSAVSIWEVAVKNALDRPDFVVDPRRLRRELLASDYRELDVTSEHGIEAASLPLLHRDPFDRMLLGQARAEGLTLLTSDRHLAPYGEFVQLV
jgi:PIN domain nuclease of toxin-antitoxin system